MARQVGWGGGGVAINRGTAIIGGNTVYYKRKLLLQADMGKFV